MNLIHKASGVENPIRNDVTHLMAEATSFLARASMDICLAWRQAIKPALKSRYAKLCDKKLPIIEWLFGDNIAKVLKEFRQAEDVSKETSANLSRFGYWPKKLERVQSRKLSRVHPELGDQVTRATARMLLFVAKHC